MSKHSRLIEAACEAEEVFGPDELERFAESFTVELCERGLGTSAPRVLEQVRAVSQAEVEEYLAGRKRPLRDGFFWRRARDLSGNPY